MWLYFERMLHIFEPGVQNRLRQSEAAVNQKKEAAAEPKVKKKSGILVWAHLSSWPLSLNLRIITGLLQYILQGFL